MLVSHCVSASPNKRKHTRLPFLLDLNGIILCIALAIVGLPQEVADTFLGAIGAVNQDFVPETGIGKELVGAARMVHVEATKDSTELSLPNGWR